MIWRRNIDFFVFIGENIDAGESFWEEQNPWHSKLSELEKIRITLFPRTFNIRRVVILIS